MTHRPHWVETWIQVADVFAERSLCTRAQVGAVIVTKDNRVASQSYNGPAAGLNKKTPCTDWCPRARGETGLTANYDACPAIHAEANALIRANFTEIQGGTIYVSRACCINCAKQVANSGLARVVHRVTSDDLHRDPDSVEDYLQRAGLEVVRVRPEAWPFSEGREAGKDG